MDAQITDLGVYVDLRGCLSNRTVRAAVAAAVADVVAGIKIDGQDRSPTIDHQRWRLVDRLGEQGICDLLADRRSGMRHRVLAERYGISLSSVKRITKCP